MSLSLKADTFLWFQLKKKKVSERESRREAAAEVRKSPSERSILGITAGSKMQGPMCED